MGALGLHGITVDETDGGASMGYLAHSVAIEEISHASASVGLSYGAHSILCESDCQMGHSRAETGLSAKIDFGRTCRIAGNERTWVRIRRGVNEVGC